MPGIDGPVVPWVGEPIIAGIRDIISSMRVGTCLPQARNKPVMVLISCTSAASIFAPSFLTFGFWAWLAAMRSISSAWRWCGIIRWANMTSVSLKLGGLGAVADLWLLS